jgi:hypothetical protein
MLPNTEDGTISLIDQSTAKSPHLENVTGYLQSVETVCLQSMENETVFLQSVDNETVCICRVWRMKLCVFAECGE